jgi:hypothetical protein
LGFKYGKDNPIFSEVQMAAGSVMLVAEKSRRLPSLPSATGDLWKRPCVLADDTSDVILAAKNVIIEFDQVAMC